MHTKTEELRKHIKDSDHGNTYKTAHAIKSMSANVGALKVQSISSKIEYEGKQEGNFELNPLLLELESALMNLLSNSDKSIYNGRKRTKYN